jgi:hypothetical protein
MTRRSKTQGEGIGDPDLLAACKRRRAPVKAKPLDLHEDWAAVQGLPPYVFWLDWPYPSNYALMRLCVLGKCKGGYVLKIDKFLFKTREYERDRWRKGETFTLPASYVCFTQRQLERKINDHLKHHNSDAGREIRRLAMCMEDMQKQMAFLGVLVQELNVFETFTPRIWAQIPVRKTPRHAAPIDCSVRRDIGD